MKKGDTIGAVLCIGVISVMLALPLLAFAAGLGDSKNYTADVWCDKTCHRNVTVHDDACALYFPCVRFSEPETQTERTCMGGSVVITRRAR